MGRATSVTWSPKIDTVYALQNQLKSRDWVRWTERASGVCPSLLDESAAGVEDFIDVALSTGGHSSRGGCRVCEGAGAAPSARKNRRVLFEQLVKCCDHLCTR